MFLGNVSLVPRHIWAAGLLSITLMGAVQIQPWLVPDRAATPTPCQYAPEAPCEYASAPTCTRMQCGKAAQCPGQEGRDLEGIGAFVAADPNHEQRFTIVEPIPGTPAQQAGLQPGDVIEEIDGVDARHMPVEQAVSMLRGEPGTVVDVSVYRPDTEERFPLSITRARFHAPEAPQSGGCH